MTLTEAVFWTKKAGVALIVGVLLFIPLRLVFMILRMQTQTVKPSDEIAHASEGYGSLPDVSLTPLPLAEGANPTFQLETTAGEFPEIPPIAQVYKLPEKQQTLTALDDAKEVAAQLKFSSEPTRIGTTQQYQWSDAYGRLLIYNLNTQNFELKTDFAKDVYELKSLIPTLDDGKSNAISFLKKLKIIDENFFETAYADAVYLKFGANGEYLTANSQMEAELIRVDFFRTTKLKKLTDEETALLAKYKKGEVNINPEDVPTEITSTVRTQDIIKSNISMIIRGTRFTKIGEIYELNFNYWPIDESATETYYTKTPAEAWEDLKNGKASLRYLCAKNGEPYANYVPLNVSQFLVYDMSLVYLETKEYQNYLQPVYMIRGEARSVGNTGQPDLEFIFLSPAIKGN